MIRQPDRASLLHHLTEAVYWISERTGRIDADLIAAAPHLRLILRLGSLYHDIDVEAARAADVAVCTWPITGAIRVAEHIVMQMLALTKGLRETEAIALAANSRWAPSKRTDEDTFAYNWSGRQNVGGLLDTTIGILGFGEISAELARRLQGWGCHMLYTKRRRLPATAEVELGITYADLETILSGVDILVNLLPYAVKSDQWLDARYLSIMRAGAFLVSCGSGSVLDEGALAERVRSGQLAGVALDTFEWEPIRPDNPLLALAREGHNVLLTPHVAAGTTDSRSPGRREEYTNVVAHIEGHPLQHRIV